MELAVKPLVAVLAAALAAAGIAVATIPAQAQGTVLKGEVVEVQNVPSYTYLRLKTKDGEIWAAVASASVAKGAQVTLVDTSVMENFESKALKRKFDRIIFASLADSSASPANPHGASPARPTTIAKIAPPTGPDGKTVEQAVSGATSLKGKTVTIRGQVVKYSPGILGKNWVHLQDGSGSATAGTNDILVTTTDTTAIGEVINARGTVRTNADFGSGYTYTVLVEDAKLRK
jgi:hypothetical protein